MRLIDADKARETAVIDLVVHHLDRQPTVDAVPVVRCKDCKHRYSSEFCECRDPDAFCSDGEREKEQIS